MTNETILTQLERDLISLVESCKSDEMDASDAVNRYYELAEQAEEKMDMSLLTEEQTKKIHPYFDQLVEMEDAFVESMLARVAE